MAADGQLVARTGGAAGHPAPGRGPAGQLGAGGGGNQDGRRDGTGLTLAHEDGQPRWVAVSDAALELLEQLQHDFGEGPCLAAFAEDRVVAVEDLQSERVWDQIAAVVGQLQVQVECAGAAGQPAGRDPGCVCDPAAGLDDRRGGGVGGAGW